MAVSPEKKEQVEAVLKAMPETLNGGEMIALIVTMLKMYGMEDEWAEMSVAVTATIAEISTRGVTMN